MGVNASKPRPHLVMSCLRHVTVWMKCVMYKRLCSYLLSSLSEHHQQHHQQRRRRASPQHKIPIIESIMSLDLTPNNLGLDYDLDLEMFHLPPSLQKKNPPQEKKLFSSSGKNVQIRLDLPYPFSAKNQLSTPKSQASTFQLPSPFIP